MTINYLSLAVSEVHRLAPYVPGKAIEELERETGRNAESIIKLASNEVALPPPPAVLAATETVPGTVPGTTTSVEPGDGMDQALSGGRR